MAAVAIGSTTLNTDANKVSYWTFDSSNSNDSWSTNNGTDTAISYAAGKFSNAATFNGTTSIINVGHATNLNITAAFSVSYWMKTNGHPGGGKVLIGKGNLTANNTFAWTCILLTGGTLRFAISNGTTEFDVDTTTDVTDNTFRNIVCTFNPSTATKIYMNGTNENTNSTSIPATVTSLAATDVIMGNSIGESRFYTGTLDDVAIFNRVLTANEANGIANGFPSSGAFLPMFM